MMQDMTGDSLRSQRLRLGWSREQLAHTVGVASSRVAAWENDNAPIDCPRAVEQVLGRRDREHDTSFRATATDLGAREAR
jgi:transcriptional regulator with XRE-family HTH domain